MIKLLFLTALVLVSCNSTTKKEVFDGTYTYAGWWADTHWAFEFKENGTFSRTSDGHYGTTNVTGTYVLKGDTIQILSGYKNTHETVNEFYLIEGNKLIDLELGYDYKETQEPDEENYISKQRL